MITSKECQQSGTNFHTCDEFEGPNFPLLGVIYTYYCSLTTGTFTGRDEAGPGEHPAAPALSIQHITEMPVLTAVDVLR